jgi:hypothetical protein
MRWVLGRCVMGLLELTIVGDLGSVLGEGWLHRACQLK